MKFNEFSELATLTDDDILLLQQTSSSVVKKIKLSTLKKYIGVTSGGTTSNIKVEILKDSPIGYWQLDEIGSTTATNLGSGMSDGIYENVLLGQPSLAIGSSYSATFNNPSSKLNATNTILNNNTDISLEAVVYLPTASLNGLIINVGSRSEIGFGIGGSGDTNSPGNSFVGIAGDVSWKPTYKSIGIGTHHLGMVYKGASNKEWLFYIDGFNIATLPGNTINVPDNKFVIGGIVNSLIRVDEVAIYNKVLPPIKWLNHANTVIY